MSHYDISRGVIYPYHKYVDYHCGSIDYYSGIDLVDVAFKSTLIILSNMYDSDELNLKGIDSGLIERISLYWDGGDFFF